MLREGSDMRSSCVRLSQLAYVRRRTILRAPLQLSLYLLCFHKRAPAVARGYVRGYTVAVVVWKKHTSFWCVSVPLLSTPAWQVPSSLDEGRLGRERNNFLIKYFRTFQISRPKSRLSPNFPFVLSLWQPHDRPSRHSPINAST